MATLPESGKHPVPRSTAPWKLKAESYMLFLKLKKLPDGVYDPVEENWADEKTHGEFKGGLGGVMIIRYSDTPVGSYDEIMFLPGTFNVPQPLNGPPKIPKKALRICRIYVSQRTTTYNGRLNWNIPKHLARFEFSAPPTPAGHSPPASLDVKVYPPGTKDGDGIAPFFSCTLTPFKWLPSIPISTRWVPISTAQVQPPIPEPAGFKQAVEHTLSGPEIDPYDINPEHQLSLLAGTDRWCAYDVNSYAPRARGCWVTINNPLNGAAEANTSEEASPAQQGSKYFPQGLQPWRIGAWLEDAEIDISAPLEWKL